ncbi:MAG TPA: DUF3943 domain-containing protein [Ignavibacteria bacterium]|nr:DUF3943 domain-containing protein [Ignavibacteria bacterium]
MPIKKFTPFIITILLFAGINILPAQESGSSRELTLKMLSDKISESDNKSKITLRLNSKEKDQFSSVSNRDFSEFNTSPLLKNYDDLSPAKDNFTPKFQVSKNHFDKNKDISKYFPEKYVPWESTRHFGLAVFDELFFNIAFPWALARFGRDWDEPGQGERWPFIGFQSIWSNINNGWNYDGDNFETNLFAHPFGGSLFYNSGRSNGYNFWESSAFALAGSYLWETFMETNQPAINDWVNTGMNGAAFGEILYRLSTMINDNTARGSHRVWTEIAGGIFNPVRLFTRLVTGEASRVFPNPEWRTPDYFDLNLDAGTRVLTNDSSNNKELEGLFELEIEYGDEFLHKITTPFSYFYFNLGIASNAPALTSMNAIGSLFSFMISNKEKAKYSLETTLNYDYYNNVGFIYGNAAIVEQLNTEFSLNKKNNLNLWTNINLRLIPMGATANNYFLDSTDGRNYDFGQGLGGSIGFEIYKGDWNIFEVDYTMDYLWTQSEPSFSKHLLQWGELRFQLPLKDYFVFGVGLGYYKRNSYYNYPNGFILDPATGQPMPTPDVSFETPIIRAFFKTRLF